jgi:hypothetical protein
MGQRRLRDGDCARRRSHSWNGPRPGSPAPQSRRFPLLAAASFTGADASRAPRAGPGAQSSPARRIAAAAAEGPRRQAGRRRGWQPASRPGSGREAARAAVVDRSRPVRLPMASWRGRRWPPFVLRPGSNSSPAILPAVLFAPQLFTRATSRPGMSAPPAPAPLTISQPLWRQVARGRPV